jgi:hypothetical protein
MFSTTYLGRLGTMDTIKPSRLLLWWKKRRKTVLNHPPMMGTLGTKGTLTPAVQSQKIIHQYLIKIKIIN